MQTVAQEAVEQIYAGMMPPMAALPVVMPGLTGTMARLAGMVQMLPRLVAVMLVGLERLMGSAFEAPAAMVAVAFIGSQRLARTMLSAARFSQRMAALPVVVFSVFVAIMSIVTAVTIMPIMTSSVPGAVTSLLLGMPVPLGAVLTCSCSGCGDRLSEGRALARLGCCRTRRQCERAGQGQKCHPMSHRRPPCSANAQA